MDILVTLRLDYGMGMTTSHTDLVFLLNMSPLPLLKESPKPATGSSWQNRWEHVKGCKTMSIQ